MKKRIFTIFLIMILAVTNLSVCYAAGINDLVNINVDNYKDTLDADFTNGLNDGTTPDDPTGTGESASGIIKMLMDIITWIPEQIMHGILIVVQMIVPMMDIVIFGDQAGASLWGTFCQLTYFDSVPKGLASHLVAYVSAFYQTFRYLALMGFIVAIAAIAVKMILASVGKQKQQYKEALKNWLVGLCLLVVGHWIMIYSIYFSNFLVDIIYDIKEAILPTTTNSLIGVFSKCITGASLSNIFAWMLAIFLLIVAIFVFVSMNLKIFKIYLERVVIVGVLIVIYPLVTVFYAFEKAGIKKGSTFETWLKTFMDQVFIQPIHAVSLVFVMLALSAVESTQITKIPVIGVVIVLMVLNFVFSIENIVKRVFSINGASMGSPIDAMGAVNKGLRMAAPAQRRLKNDGKKAINEAKAAGKNWFKAGMAGQGAMLKSAFGGNAYKMATSGKYGRQNLQSLVGMTGLSIPDEIFNVDRLSQKEQKDATRRIKNAAGTVNIKSVCGVGLHDDVRNMENMMDQDIMLDLKVKYGVTDKMVKDYTLSGKVPEGKNPTETKENEAKIRRYMAALADPTTDFSTFDTPEDLDYYFDASDSDVKHDLSSGRHISKGNPVDSKVVRARKKYTLQHQDEVTSYMRALDLDDEKIKDVEDGSCNDPEVVKKYKIMVSACATGNSISAYKDSSGAFTDTIYNGVSMEPMALSGAAAEIVRDMPDVIKNPAEGEKARTILVGLKNKDKDKFARVANSVDPQVTVNDLNNFIEEKPVSAACDSAKILEVIKQLNTKK